MELFVGMLDDDVGDFVGIVVCEVFSYYVLFGIFFFCSYWF